MGSEATSLLNVGRWTLDVHFHIKGDHLGMVEYFKNPLNTVFAVVFIFLSVNLSLRFYTDFHYIDVMLPSRDVRLYYALITGITILSVAGLFGMVWFSKYLKGMLFVFGLSFTLFGFQPYTPYSQVFEVIVTFGALALLLIHVKDRSFHVGNRRLLFLLLLYVGFSGLSLFQLPLFQVVKGFELWGASWSFLIFGAVPSWYEYAIAGVNKLLLFVIFVVLLSGLEGNRALYRSVFLGALWGAVMSTIAGLLEYSGVISLTWFRSLDGNAASAGTLRLYSIFGNPGWFAEFVTVISPFVLIGFLKKDAGNFLKVFLFGILILFEIALLLTMSRSGWVCYPLTLSACWIFLYLYKNSEKGVVLQLSRKNLIKVVASIPVTLLISLFVVFKLLGPASVSIQKNATEKVSSDATLKAGPRFEYLKSRATGILNKGSRIPVWMQGMGVGWERPLFGMGYESFGWNAKVLKNIENSFLVRNGLPKKLFDTPHNLYVQLFVNGGFAGLFLWCSMIGYVFMLLVADLLKNRVYFHVCILLSIIGFHIFGIFQSMQYVPMIWFLIFLMIGYALTIDDGVLPPRIRKAARFFLKLCVVLVLIGGVVYLSNFESKGLAEKYELEVYREDPDKVRYFGFHPLLDGKYRWSGKRAAIDITGARMVEIDFKCETPGVEKDPVVLSVYRDRVLLDTVSFSKKETVRKKYLFPEASGKTEELVLEVSRTWNPYKILGKYDRRDLGVLVRVVGVDVESGLVNK